MAAVNFPSMDTITAQFVGVPDPCFLCGAPIHEIGVYWDAHGKKLFLHERCAKEFGCHLIGDAIKAKTMRGQLFRRVTVPKLVDDVA